MNLLLIDCSIPYCDDFVNSLNDNTKCVVYNCKDTVKTIKNNILKLNIDKINNLGFVFVESGNYKMIGNTEVKSDEMKLFVHEIVLKYDIKTIDFLACNLLNFDKWKNYFNFLQTDNNVIVRGSNNVTGNLKYGGDWILETTDQDVKKLYFNSNISNWKGVLDLPSSTFLIKNGILYVCGFNSYGNLGIGMGYFIVSEDALPVTAITERVIGVGASDNNTLAFTLETNNNLYVTGRNNAGQLGLGNKTNINEFQKTSGFTDKTVIGVACGNDHCLVITSEEKNNLYVAGSNASGQIGLGNSVTEQTTFLNGVTNLIDKTIIGVYCGGNSSIVLTSENEIYVTGSNYYGQLGLPSTPNALTSFTKNTFSKKILGVSMSYNFSLIITNESSSNLYATGNLAWKSNLFNATLQNGYVKLVEVTKKITQISCGQEHAGIITSNGELHMAGQNNHGELGFATSDNTLFKRCSTPTYPKLIMCLNNYSLLLNDSHHLYVAGADNNGQLNLLAFNDNKTVFTLNTLLDPITHVEKMFPVRAIDMTCDANVGATLTQQFITTLATGTINADSYIFTIVTDPTIGFVTTYGSNFIYTPPSQLKKLPKQKVQKMVNKIKQKKLKTTRTVTFTYTVTDSLYNIVSNVGTVTINLSSTPAPTPPPSPNNNIPSITLYNKGNPQNISLNTYYNKITPTQNNPNTANVTITAILDVFISSENTKPKSTIEGKNIITVYKNIPLTYDRTTKKYNCVFLLQYSSIEKNDIDSSITLSVENNGDVVIPLYLKSQNNNIRDISGRVVKPISGFVPLGKGIIIPIEELTKMIKVKNAEDKAKQELKKKLNDPNDLTGVVFNVLTSKIFNGYFLSALSLNKNDGVRTVYFTRNVFNERNVVIRLYLATILPTDPDDSNKYLKKNFTYYYMFGVNFDKYINLMYFDEKAGTFFLLTEKQKIPKDEVAGLYVGIKNDISNMFIFDWIFFKSA